MKKIILSLLLVMFAFTLTACKGDDDGTQGVYEDRIVVGNAAATSGGYADVGLPFNAAIEAYFKMVNDEGGIANRIIEFKHYDDEYDAAQGLERITELVEDDKVFAIVGHFGTPTVGATHDYLNEIGIPRVYYATGISTLFQPNATGGERGSFPVQPIFDAEGEVMVARAVGNLNASKIGVIYTNDDAGQGMLNGIELRADDLGVELVKRQVVVGSVDMSSAAQAMLSNNVDVVIVAANQDPAVTAIRALADASSTIPVVTSYVNADASWLAKAMPGGEIAFDLYASSWVDALGNMEDLLLFMEHIDPQYAANAYAFAGWIAAATFVEGLRRVGEDELTWTSYIEAMEQEPVSLPFGVIVDYADGRRVGTQAMAFLKAIKEEDALIWDTVEPIQMINDILG